MMLPLGPVAKNLTLPVAIVRIDIFEERDWKERISLADLLFDSRDIRTPTAESA
jgi:hypothetical protein